MFYSQAQIVDLNIKKYLNIFKWLKIMYICFLEFFLKYIWIFISLSSYEQILYAYQKCALK